jgi:RNA polymerase sigma-70 factor, ECF subfamily
LSVFSGFASKKGPLFANAPSLSRADQQPLFRAAALRDAPPEFDEIFAQQSPFVWRVLLRLGVQGRDAPDACQEVFLVVHRRLSELDAARGSVRAWVYGICVRVASDYRRRHPNRHETSDQQLAQLAVAAPQEAALEEQRAWQQLANVLDRMDPAKREAFVLYELEALSMAEVASILNCPLQTAYARLHAARRLVLAAFQEQEQA